WTRPCGGLAKRAHPGGHERRDLPRRGMFPRPIPLGDCCRSLQWKPLRLRNLLLAQRSEVCVPFALKDAGSAKKMPRTDTRAAGSVRGPLTSSVEPCRRFHITPYVSVPEHSLSGSAARRASGHHRRRTEGGPSHVKESDDPRCPVAGAGLDGSTDR